MIHRLASILGALAVGLLAAGPARAVTYGDVDVTIESLPRGYPSHGYNVYQFTVVNRSPGQAHEVRLELPKTLHMAHEDHIRSLTRTVTVEPGAAVHLDLLQPVRMTLYGEGVSVFVDGREQEDPLRLNFSSHGVGPRSYGHYGGSPTGMVVPVVLVSPTCRAFLRRAEEVAGGLAGPMGSSGVHRGPAPALGTVKRGPGGMPGSMPGGMPGGMPPGGMPAPTMNVEFAKADAEVSAWSSNWLSYSRYDGIVVSGEDILAPSAVRTALWQYAECGGTLLILGDPGKVLPGSWTRHDPKGEPFIGYEAGFGTCLVYPGGNLTDLHALVPHWIRPGQPLRTTRSIANANAVFPVVDDIGIPVRSLLVLMIVFVILIGPVNLWVLARYQRRIWMLWTIPAISLVTCLAVFGCMLIVEGWQGHLRTETITILDQGTKRATTIGWTAFYSPLTPGDGLHFSRATELAPQRAEPWWHGAGTACSIDWTQDQHLTRGWVAARVPAHFMVRKSETRHERVTLLWAPGDSWVMVNGLGEDVRQFWFADREGNLYGADKVPAGGQATLTSLKRSLPAGRESRQAIYQSDWLERMQSIPRNPDRVLAPGTYLAVLDGAPFLEDGLRNAKTRKRRALVLGILEAADAR